MVINVSKELIKRKLEAAKKEISDLQKKVDAPIKEPKQTTNLVPAGVQQTPPDSGVNEQPVPGFITGGPRTSKKMKEV